MAEDKAIRKRWTEEETIMALYLYFQLPFGKLHSRNPEIQSLALKLERPSNSIAMKLCNFASLDPKITATGRKGLNGASAQDRAIYSRFQSDWEGLVRLASELWERRVGAENNSLDFEDALHLKEARSDFRFSPYEGESENLSIVRQRRGQDFFRRAVLANFDEKCCITGIAEKKLLVASHIRPWRLDVNHRHNPENGFLLSATMDKAFDSGLITIDLNFRIRVSGILSKNFSEETRSYFNQYASAEIRQPVRFEPDPSFIEWHMREVFLDRD